ncbi:CHASE2 domain-containing serine/threonine-protein kinase [Chamaesiphon sp. VAR_48_metabat_135_sub]|uniref:CHASE2 domain-containing serine/threonine-protein kinase n=1 Tax=Chamaesiphon sp. VAR_48_metabat_135_sub TaxID=2964699 RepID=UPI00286AB331|nr:CHASE2 domain-containing serine/threonine-protein kinase [Chamaesiphon sp. VAR_48_metabat_135_sub]
MFLKIELSSIWKSLISRKVQWQVATILGVSLGVTGLVVGTKSIGWWEMSELTVYDQSVRWKSPLPPDPRLLIVAITEEDLNLQKVWPLPDRTIAKIIQKLTDAKAKIIGLDVFRANPVNPGHEDLVEIWERNDVIVPGCHHRNFQDPGIAGPPGIPPEQLGFLDVLVDRDSIVRRGLLFMSRNPKSPCTSETSLALQLAQEYLLRQHNIQGEFDSKQEFHIANAHFRPIARHDGGYQDAESGGYQILLNYRSRYAVAKIVSITDLLNNRVNPKLIKDRIVLIGSTASSLNDDFLTPYSAGKAEDATMPGVMVHAQITSQILSAVLDKQPLWWFIPDWLEGMWIGCWCLTGSLLAWYVRHPIQLLVTIGGAVIVLVGGFAIAFAHAAWIPLVSPFVGLIVSSIGVLGFTSYQAQQQQQDMESLVKEREQAIAALNLLLSQTAPPVTAPPLLLPPTALPPTELPQTTMAHPATLDPNLTVPYQPNPTLKQDPIPTPAPPMGALLPNYLLDGRYQVEHTLGAGGFGMTYLARDTKRPGKPQCAIKQLVPARRDANFVSLARRLFNTEAEILSKLGHHPQIPHLLAYFEDRQEFYLVQEFIDGMTLDRELEGATQPWTEEQVLDLLRQLLPVLGFIHSQYVIHRDLKPGNIIRERHHSKLVLIDFGAVKEIQPQVTDEQNVTISIGTRGYTPPEQYAGQPNYTSDLYALGSIAIEALTNIQPRYLPVNKDTGNMIWHDLVTVSPALIQVLDKMVAYNFPDRYQSATAVLLDLPSV